MRNLQEYGLWLVLVTINAVIVSQWVNYLTIMSNDYDNITAYHYSVYRPALHLPILKAV